MHPSITSLFKKRPSVRKICLSKNTFSITACLLFRGTTQAYTYLKVPGFSCCAFTTSPEPSMPSSYRIQCMSPGCLSHFLWPGFCWVLWLYRVPVVRCSVSLIPEVWQQLSRAKPATLLRLVFMAFKAHSRVSNSTGLPLFHLFAASALEAFKGCCRTPSRTLQVCPT